MRRSAIATLFALSLDENGNDLAAVNEHEAVASLLLERSIALDAELGKHVAGSAHRLAFVKYLIQQRSLDFAHAPPAGPWQAFVMEHPHLAQCRTICRTRQRWVTSRA